MWLDTFPILSLLWAILGFLCSKVWGKYLLCTVVLLSSIFLEKATEGDSPVPFLSLIVVPVTSFVGPSGLSFWREVVFSSIFPLLSILLWRLP